MTSGADLAYIAEQSFQKNYGSGVYYKLTADIDLANGLFNGKVSTINEMCKGNIRLAGVLSMVDNVNRILDRVAVYLG